MVLAEELHAGSLRWSERPIVEKPAAALTMDGELSGRLSQTRVSNVSEAF